MDAAIKVPSALFENDGMGASDKSVFAALCYFTERDGECRPSLTELARASGLSARGVVKVLAKLEARGNLRREHRFDSSSRRSSNCYSELSAVPLADAKTPDRHSEQSAVSLTDDDKLLADAARLWNLKLTALPPAGAITPSMRRSFAARLAEAPERRELSWWASFFGQAARNKWLCGGNPTGWRPDFAELLKDGDRMKQIEQGSYGRQKMGEACAVGDLAEYVTRLGKANFGEDWNLKAWS